MTLLHARPRTLFQIARQRLYSESQAFGLMRDLNIYFPTPAANLPLTIRPLRQDDVAKLLDLNTPGIDSDGIHLRLSRQLLVESKIPECFVGETPEGDPCYMQWLFGAEQNDAIQRHFHGYFPWLKQDEALLEGAFTPENYRGYRIMPCAMAQIAGEAAKFGARKVLTFVAVDNIPSLKGCKRAGFNIHLTRMERWRFFGRKVTFSLLPENTPYPFDASSEKQVSMCASDLAKAPLNEDRRRFS